MLRSTPLISLLALLLGCNFGLGDLGVYEDLADLGDHDEEEDDEQPTGEEDVQDDDDNVLDDDDNVLDDDDTSGSDDDDTAEIPQDLDGDGYPADIDCDDNNAEVHPGALEVACDGLDNDCDQLFLPDDIDSDGDGFSPCLGDCDDSDAGIGTHASEIQCDGLDNDCDGVDDCDGDDPEVPPSSGDVCASSATFGALGSNPLIGMLDPADPTYGAGYHYEIWEVTVPVGGAFTADLVSFDFDAWIEIYDSSCGFIGYDDDSYMFLGTDASYPFSGGSAGAQVYILATSYGAGATGTYLLDVY